MPDLLCFSVLADLHYKKGMYPACVSDLETVLSGSAEQGAELILQLGDLCNDYIRSPELMNAYLKNRYRLPVYGIYGNHELETRGNTMSFVTPRLTNQADAVVWGTDSGTVEDGSIGYYYFDRSGIRFICLDTNYSLNPDTGLYEHNAAASWGPPKQNLYPNSLGTRQLEWLRQVLQTAVDQGLRCIVSSHAALAEAWQRCPEALIVRQMFREANARAPKTVLLVLNGHAHTHHYAMADGVLYADISAVKNGYWSSNRLDLYAEPDIKDPLYTFLYTEYDQGGTPAVSFYRPLSTLTMGNQSCFYKDPVYVTVTVREDGTVWIKGCETQWIYGIEPPMQNAAERLRIPDIDTACLP